jgi:BirA family biotin operon repressor/biotin-[acetyl-CoA-carboxylase] ligase
MTPALPRVYELIRPSQVEDTVAAAQQFALQGAEEGTLVWPKIEQAPRGRRQAWLTAAGDLSFALVMRPEESPLTSAQLCAVAAVSLGATVADLVPPMTELHYHWPHQVLLAGGRLAGIDLRGPAGVDSLPWLALGVHVNIKRSAPELGFAAASFEVEGNCTTDAGEVLQGFCRHFLSAVDRWSQRGPDSILRSWKGRMMGMGEPVELSVANDKIAGKATDIDTHGSLLIDLGSDVVRTVSIAEFFGLGEKNP